MLFLGDGMTPLHVDGMVGVQFFPVSLLILTKGTSGNTMNLVIC